MTLKRQEQEEICSAVDQAAYVTVCDSDGKLIYLNDKFIFASGFSRDELLGCTFGKIDSGHHEKEFFSEIQRSISSGHTWRGEICHLSKTGFRFWVDTTIVPISTGEFPKTIRIGYDVTERKSTEQSLADSQIFSKTLMQVASVGIFLTNPFGRCTYVNEKWSALSGIKSRKAMGAGWESALHPADSARVSSEWKKFLIGEAPFQCQYRYLQAESKVTWVLASAVLLRDSSGKKSGILRTEQDMTEYKEKEITILEQQATIIAASKMSSLGEMAGGIAHEINNPLAVINNISSQMQEVLGDEVLDLETLIAMANKIERTTGRIAKIVAGLRSFSRDGSKDACAFVNLPTLIEETVSLCRERFKNHNIALRVRDIPAIEIEVRSTELSQVILNLLNNAHDALDGLSEKWVELSFIDQGDSLAIKVTDSGKGIPYDVQKKIFQPFFTTKDIGKGTGLGLSISEGIIKSHSGKLEINNTSPNTEFVIYLPKKQGAAKKAA